MQESHWSGKEASTGSCTCSGVTRALKVKYPLPSNLHKKDWLEQNHKVYKMSIRVTTEPELKITKWNTRKKSFYPLKYPVSP